MYFFLFWLKLCLSPLFQLHAFIFLDSLLLLHLIALSLYHFCFFLKYLSCFLSLSASLLFFFFIVAVVRLHKTHFLAWKAKDVFFSWLENSAKILFTNWRSILQTQTWPFFWMRFVENMCLTVYISERKKEKKRGEERGPR